MLAASLALASAAPAQVANRDTASSTLRAATASPAIPEINVDVRLLHHTMRGVAGKPVPATTLLLVPKGTPTLLHPPSPAKRQALPLGVRNPRQEVAIDVPGVLTLDHNGIRAEAAVAGLEIAYVSERAVRTWLGDRRLVAVLDDWCPRIPGLCLYYPGHRHVPAGLRAFIEVANDARL